MELTEKAARVTENVQQMSTMMFRDQRSTF